METKSNECSWTRDESRLLDELKISDEKLVAYVPPNMHVGEYWDGYNVWYCRLNEYDTDRHGWFKEHTDAKQSAEDHARKFIQCRQQESQQDNTGDSLSDSPSQEPAFPAKTRDTGRWRSR